MAVLLSRWFKPIAQPLTSIAFPSNRRTPIAEVLELAGLGSKLDEQYGVCVQYVGSVNYPEDYDTRLTQLFPGADTNKRLFALEAHDLALSKLERNSAKDREDVRFLAKAAPLDPALLERRNRQEMRPYLSKEERHDLTLRLWLEIIAEQLGPPHPPAQSE